MHRTPTDELEGRTKCETRSSMKLFRLPRVAIRLEGFSRKSDFVIRTSDFGRAGPSKKRTKAWTVCTTSNSITIAALARCLSRRFPFPNLHCIRRALAAHAVVGQNLVGSGQHLAAKENQCFCAPHVKINGDVFILAVTQDLN